MQYLLGKVCTQVIISLFYIHNLCWVEDVALLLNVKLDAGESCLRRVGLFLFILQSQQLWLHMNVEVMFANMTLEAECIVSWFKQQF